MLAVMPQRRFPRDDQGDNSARSARRLPFACPAAACLPGRAQAAPTHERANPHQQKRTAKAFVDRALERAFYVACPIVDGGEVLLLRRVDGFGRHARRSSFLFDLGFASVFTFATIVVTSDPFISC